MKCGNGTELWSRGRFARGCSQLLWSMKSVALTQCYNPPTQGRTSKLCGACNEERGLWKVNLCRRCCKRVEVEVEEVEA